MKIVYFIGTLNAGGIERFTSRLTKYVCKNELFKIGIVCLIKKEGIFLKDLEDLGIKIIEFPSNWHSNISSLKKSSEMLLENFGNFDIIHSQVNFSLFQQYLILRRAGFKKLIVTERSCYPLISFKDYFKRLAQFYFLRILKVRYTANSIGVQQYLSKKMFCPTSSIPVINNGIEAINEIKKDESTLYNGNRKFKLIYVGRMEICKGQRFFINVLNHLKMKKIEFSATFLGNGPDMNNLINLVSKYNLKNDIVFEGIVTNPEDYISQSDLLCLFSTREGMPNVVLESMFYETPVFANNVGNVEELLSNNCGFVNYMSSVEESANKIIDIINNYEIATECSINAKNKVLKNFTLKNTTDLLMFHYKKL